MVCTPLVHGTLVACYKPYVGISCALVSLDYYFQVWVSLLVHCWTQGLGREPTGFQDPSTKLVGIADTFGDPPFGRFHRLSAFASLCFESLGDMGSAQWNKRRSPDRSGTR
ncbi:hypothetical protein MTR67_030406 [Solanum verrucosum]|uniref:Uncharacterized protein n=1 Tax=Solanum verrucosum TaxID=315347 RepID=A0AAF0R7M1_SOLVR|nr:hypothetical protein MTR67_030406 [Solanum verrucosum]